MNNDAVTILTYIGENDGCVSRTDLYDVFPTKKCLISSLATGTRPNIFLDATTNDFKLTKRGYESLLSANVEIEIDVDILPDFIRDANGSAHRRRRNATPNANGCVCDMMAIEIDRNDYVKIKIVVHEKFLSWVKANGRLVKLTEGYGSDAVRTWDATNETVFYAIDLKNIDANFSGISRIISDSGINPLLIKLACATETGTYEVKYKGLVSWEHVNRYGQSIAQNIDAFYKNYVQPFNLKISVQFTLGA